MGKRGPKPVPIEGRFWAKVDKNGPLLVPELGRCWNWTGAKESTGRGKIGRRPGSPLVASRVSWELHFGQIPTGLEVCHHCDNPQCTNPKHLHLGTHAQNMRERDERGRCVRGERHWKAKLTAGDVLKIRAMLAEGKPREEIAVAAGVAKEHISLIAHRVIWKHLEAA